jgi:hypothetical protein
MSIRPVYRMRAAERERGVRPEGLLRINRLMSEAICTHPAFHLPGGNQTIRQSGAAQERQRRSGRAAILVFTSSSLAYPPRSACPAFLLAGPAETMSKMLYGMTTIYAPVCHPDIIGCPPTVHLCAPFESATRSVLRSSSRPCGRLPSLPTLAFTKI